MSHSSPDSRPIAHPPRDPRATPLNRTPLSSSVRQPLPRPNLRSYKQRDAALPSNATRRSDQSRATPVRPLQARASGTLRAGSPETTTRSPAASTKAMKANAADIRHSRRAQENVRQIGRSYGLIRRTPQEHRLFHPRMAQKNPRQLQA